MTGSKFSLLSVSDLALGSVGSAIPPSKTIDHSVRYFGTWSGSDKLLMTAQYAAKLLVPVLLKRAQLQFAVGLRPKPYSATAEGLTKFAASVSAARRVSGLWGILPIIKWLSAMERAPRSADSSGSRLPLTLERLQGLSMLAFYILENISFFSSPAAPILPQSIITPARSGLAQLWAVRAWGLYTAIQLANLVGQHIALTKEERALAKMETTVNHPANNIKKKKAAVTLSLLENGAFAPLIVHWSVIGGVFKSELPVNILSLVAALAAFKAGWEKTSI